MKSSQSYTATCWLFCFNKCTWSNTCGGWIIQKVSEYDQERPQPQTADQTMAVHCEEETQNTAIVQITLSLPNTSKTNTSVPSMFQGLLNIEGILVQHRLSQQPFNILLWRFHGKLHIYKTFTYDFYCMYETFIWINNNNNNNNNNNSHVTVGGHFWSHTELWKMPVNNYFMQNRLSINLHQVPSLRIYSDIIFFNQK